MRNTYRLGFRDDPRLSTLGKMWYDKLNIIRMQSGMGAWGQHNGLYTAARGFNLEC